MAGDDVAKAQAETSTLVASIDKLKDEVKRIAADADEIRKIVDQNAKVESELNKLLR